MQRFIDSELFPNDLIADYFQSQAPIGYSSIYKLMASLGIHPFLFNKIVPVILSLITTIYCFLFTLYIDITYFKILIWSTRWGSSSIGTMSNSLTKRWMEGRPTKCTVLCP